MTWNINKMEMIFLGTSGFLLYLIYDINSVKGNHPVLRYFFGAGSLCLVIATIKTLVRVFDYTQRNLPSIILLSVVGLIFFLLLIYTLFFALPFEETYLEESRERMAYTEGVYGLCRHPGVLWFSGFYLCLWGISGFSWNGIFFPLMIVWNVFYVIFQDVWTFPRTFTNYGAYKKKTPFLIPNRDSIHVCISTWNVLNRGER